MESLTYMYEAKPSIISSYCKHELHESWISCIFFVVGQHQATVIMHALSHKARWRRRQGNRVGAAREAETARWAAAVASIAPPPRVFKRRNQNCCIGLLVMDEVGGGGRTQGGGGGAVPYRAATGRGGGIGAARYGCEARNFTWKL